MNEEKQNGLCECNCSALCISSADRGLDGDPLSNTAGHQALIHDASLRDKEIILARRYQLGFATFLGLTIIVFDMYCSVTTGHGYKSPEWAIAIITAVYLGASGNQVLSMIEGVLKGKKKP